MNISIQHNVMADNASRHLGTHYASLARSVERLSSGLRVNRSADDAAGLSIRELMRAQVASLRQGIRNANDAISLIQTADGALSIIDEKLIRMKELAEQAATGTYNSDQRLMIDQEFQAMGAEINRIATATDFNGIKLLDGSLSGSHDGSGLTSTGEVKVHFGTGNDSAEDYYYITIGDASTKGLGLGQATDDGIANMMLWSWNQVNVYPVIPQGSTNVQFAVGSSYWTNNAIQLFTKSGQHLAGSVLGDAEWAAAGYDSINIDSLLTEANGFNPGASYTGNVNGTGSDVTFTEINAFPPYIMHDVSGDGNITYSGNAYIPGVRGMGGVLHINTVSEDLIVIVVGQGAVRTGITGSFLQGSAFTNWAEQSAISIETQALAQEALEKINDAVVRKDQIRAHLGALQNRLENTISNLQIQVENLQAAESRISDVDVAEGMTNFVRNQILTQAAIAMLAQANSMPSIALSLIQGSMK